MELPFANKVVWCMTIVSQARPFPFRSTDRFQYTAKTSWLFKPLGAWLLWLQTNWRDSSYDRLFGTKD